MQALHLLGESLHQKLWGLAKDTYEATLGLGGMAPGLELGTAHPARSSVGVRHHLVGLPEHSKVDEEEPQDATGVLFVFPHKVTELNKVVTD